MNDLIAFVKGSHSNTPFVSKKSVTSNDFEYEAAAFTAAEAPLPVRYESVNLYVVSYLWAAHITSYHTTAVRESIERMNEPFEI